MQPDLLHVPAVCSFAQALTPISSFVLMSLADMSVRRHLDLLVAFGLELLALSPFEDLQAP